MGKIMWNRNKKHDADAAAAAAADDDGDATDGDDLVLTMASRLCFHYIVMLNSLPPMKP